MRSMGTAAASGSRDFVSSCLNAKGEPVSLSWHLLNVAIYSHAGVAVGRLTVQQEVGRIAKHRTRNYDLLLSVPHHHAAVQDTLRSKKQDCRLDFLFEKGFVVH